MALGTDAGIGRREAAGSRLLPPLVRAGVLLTAEGVHYTSLDLRCILGTFPGAWHLVRG